MMRWRHGRFHAPHCGSRGSRRNGVPLIRRQRACWRVSLEPVGLGRLVQRAGGGAPPHCRTRDSAAAVVAAPRNANLAGRARQRKVHAGGLIGIGEGHRLAACYGHRRIQAAHEVVEPRRLSQINESESAHHRSSLSASLHCFARMRTFGKLTLQSETRVVRSPQIQKRYDDYTIKVVYILYFVLTQNNKTQNDNTKQHKQQTPIQ